VRVNEIEIVPADQLSHRITKYPFPLRIETYKPAIGIGDAEQIKALVKIIL
jgi:hypothetical protein